MKLSNDIATHLQALFHSGQISAYIYSKLTKGSLKTGWIEQGLLSKGMTGKLRDKNNQESLVIPSDRFARLTLDWGGWTDAAIVIIGPKGLVSSKFVAIVFKQQDSQSLISFNTQQTTPHEIVQLLLQNVLGKEVSKAFEEPNLDYIEQLKMDTSEGMIDEMTVLTLPKKQIKISDWMKEALLSPSSESVEFQYGTANIIPKFAALISRWLTGLELFKSTRKGIAALIFKSKKTTEACFWDAPQRIATFAAFNHSNLQSLSRKYLTPLWIVPGESAEPPAPSREVTVETRKASVSAKMPSASATHVEISKGDSVRVLTDLSKRLDNLETQIKSTKTSSPVSDKDRGTMDVLQSRLSENIERIESLTRRLSNLEQRLKKIRT
jgi:hypothetical protein